MGLFDLLTRVFSLGRYRAYTVRKGDTLSGIAQKMLGDADRYPEIFNANRSKLEHPDRIDIGQVLRIPRR